MYCEIIIPQVNIDIASKPLQPQVSHRWKQVNERGEQLRVNLQQ